MRFTPDFVLQKHSNRAGYLFVIIALSTFFLLIFSRTTTPLYDFLGIHREYVASDSGLFRLVGRALISGKTLYKDIFDHKGPVLFIIEALGVWISPEVTGILIVQILNLSLVLILIRKIALLFVTEKQSWLVITFSLLFLATTLREGNTSEEFSLFFLFLPLYLFLKNFIKKTGSYPLKHTFIYGICFSLIVYNRLTNAAPLAALVLTIVVILIKEKRWFELLKHAGSFLLAFLLIGGIFSVYFYKQGLLYDMYYATLLYNFKYGVGGVSDKNYSRGFFKLSLYSLVILLFAVLTTFIYNKKKNNKEGKVLLLLSIFNLFFCFTETSIIGKSYINYHIINLFSVAYSVSVAIHNWYDIHLCKMQKKLCMVTAVLLIYPFSSLMMYALRPHVEGEVDVANYLDLEIPQDEKDSVIAYGLFASWYIKEDIIPCCKYFVNQEWWSKADSRILEEFNYIMENQSPLWIVTKTTYKNQKLFEILNRKYTEVMSNKYYIAYTLRPEYRSGI